MELKQEQDIFQDFGGHLSAKADDCGILQTFFKNSDRKINKLVLMPYKTGPIH